jgi:uncharacterized membrane protein YjgN (DUF898 family)
VNDAPRTDPVRIGVVSPPPAGVPVETRLHFSGTGTEYFRIWIVHVLLTLVTFGVYSAWAKARRERWFARHTRLLGDAFDYHGRPASILSGRLVAIVGYLIINHLGEWAVSWGLLVLAMFFAAGPAFIGNAFQFRARNMSWRGLRFAFDGSVVEVYRTCFPVVFLLTLSPLSLMMHASPLVTKWSATLAALAWPGVHAGLKALQHTRTRLGGRQFAFSSVVAALYGLYGKACLLVIAMTIAIGGALSAWLPAAETATISSILVIVCVVLIVWPFFSVRAQQLVWSRTSYGEVRFRVEIRTAALWWLIVRNAVLILLTAGLFWPFAAVAMARLRTQGVVLESLDSLTELTETEPGRRARAVGDAFADLFGFEVGW